jgi:sugar/nucleoside kinase (ribokinase family)
MDRPQQLLKSVDVLVFSAEDVNYDPDAMRDLRKAVPITVVTYAADGAVVYTRHGPVPSPARHTTVVDPTGAGDVFAAAFFIRLYERGDPIEAAAFANVVASFSVEAQGIAAIPARATVEEWFAAHTRS